MSLVRFTPALLAGAALLVALPADAQQQQRRRPADSQSAMVEQLNAESLRRAQQGQNSPTPGPDTTQNLNRMSDQDARRGQPMPQPPMPFR
jgi:hypothetical protein